MTTDPGWAADPQFGNPRSRGDLTPADCCVTCGSDRRGSPRTQLKDPRTGTRPGAASPACLPGPALPSCPQPGSPRRCPWRCSADRPTEASREGPERGTGSGQVLSAASPPAGRLPRAPDPAPSHRLGALAASSSRPGAGPSPGAAAGGTSRRPSLLLLRRNWAEAERRRLRPVGGDFPLSSAAWPGLLPSLPERGWAGRLALVGAGKPGVPVAAFPGCSSAAPASEGRDVQPLLARRGAGEGRKPVAFLEGGRSALQVL